jgi:DNA-binding CsgD family transcriptional regulator
VLKAADDPTSELNAGWAALETGRWEEAQRAFTAANALKESAQASEGMSWAAWWRDDAQVALQARERAFCLYRDAGDRTSAVRMAAWIAADQVDFHGAIATAQGWIARGRRMLETLEPGPDHGWLAFHEGYIASLRGEHRLAEARGMETAQLGRRFNVADLEMLGLALQGAVLVARGRVDAGMPCLDEASAIALTGDAAIPMSSAWTCCFLVTACTQVLDYDRACEWCDRIAQFAQRYGSRYMLGFCRAEYAAVYLWRGRWAEAERALEESVEAFSRSRPGMVGGPLVEMAELKRRCGQPDEAAQLLERAGNSVGAQLVRAKLALDCGDVSQAVDLADRILRNVGEERVFHRVPALEILVRARAATADLEAAGRALASLEEVARLARTSGMDARVRGLAGMLAAARGDHAGAKPRLEDAVDAFERCGAPFEAAQTRLDLAATLGALERHDLSRAERERAERVLADLAASVRRTGFAAPGRAPVECTDAAPAAVSPRERAVLACVAEGLTNRQISDRLAISEHTVHRHVTNILRKLDLPSRAAAAAHAVRLGWVQL